MHKNPPFSCQKSENLIFSASSAPLPSGANTTLASCEVHNVQSVATSSEWEWDRHKHGCDVYWFLALFATVAFGFQCSQSQSTLAHKSLLSNSIKQRIKAVDTRKDRHRYWQLSCLFCLRIAYAMLHHDISCYGLAYIALRHCCFELQVWTVDPAALQYYYWPAYIQYMG